MCPSLAAMVAAALVAAGPGSAGGGGAPAESEEALLAVAIPSGLLDELARSALAVPPWTVVRETRYYGTVTIDHRAHLARRASCRGCHGPGAVSKIEFTPKIAHARCIGCHEEVAKGPAKCQGCHVRSPPRIQIASRPVPVKPPEPPKPDPANVEAALAALDAQDAGAGDGASRKVPFHRTLELGLAAGRGAGFSVRLASHQDRFVLSQSVERMSSRDEARTLGLLGAGLTRFFQGVSLEFVALAGFDVVERPIVALRPALGARAGVEWRTGHRFLPQVTGSLAGIVDLSGTRAPGGEAGRLTVYTTVTTGFSLTGK